MRKKTVGKLGLHASGRVYARVDGKMVYGPRTQDISHPDAQAWYQDLLLRHGTDGEHPVPSGTHTLDILFRAYLRSKQNETSAKHAKDTARMLERFIAALGKETPDTIQAAQVREYLDTLPRRTSGGGQRQHYAALHAAFNWLQTEYDVSRNVMRKIKRPQDHPRGDEYVISVEEWQQMLQQIPRQYHDILTVLWETGARPGELYDAEIQEYYPSLRVLDKENHKNARKGKTRVIALSPIADEIIRRRIGDRTTGLIFLNRRQRRYCDTWLCETLQRAAAAIGRVKPTITYSLRHSYAVRMLEAGTPIHDVAALLGNTVAVCERHYAHTIERLRQHARQREHLHRTLAQGE